MDKKITVLSTLLGENERFMPCPVCIGKVYIYKDANNEYWSCCSKCGYKMKINLDHRGETLDSFRLAYNWFVMYGDHHAPSIKRLKVSSGDYAVTRTDEEYVVLVGSAQEVIEYIIATEENSDVHHSVYRYEDGSFWLIGEFTPEVFP